MKSIEEIVNNKIDFYYYNLDRLISYHLSIEAGYNINKDNVYDFIKGKNLECKIYKHLGYIEYYINDKFLFQTDTLEKFYLGSYYFK